LKKQTAGRSAKSYSELERKTQVQHNTDKNKKYSKQMGVHRKAKKSARFNVRIKIHSTSKIRHEAPDAKLFLCKIDLQMCDDKSYFTFAGNGRW
jgi:hypothetical protein